MKRPRLLAARLLALALFCAATPSAANAIGYRIDLVASLSRYAGELTDINNSGQIVGYSDTGTQNYRSFIWKNGQVQYLGTLGGQATQALGINDKGHVTGWSTRSGTYPEVAMIWENGHMQSIGNLGGANSFGVAINENGMVAGYSQTRTQLDGHAYTWAEDTIAETGIYSQSEDINDLGEVVMRAESHTSYIWRNGDLINLGHLGQDDTWAYALNNHSQVVGCSKTVNGSNHAFIWQNGVLTDIGKPGCADSRAYDINESGLIVGYYYTPTGGACMWRDGVFVDMNSLLPTDSGWTLLKATAVNDLGQIVGKGIYNGQYSGFVMTPVPEPSASLILVSGLAGVCAWRRRDSRRRQGNR